MVILGSLGWVRAGDEEDKMCWDVFDVSNRTIIKVGGEEKEGEGNESVGVELQASESVSRGAVFLGASEDARQTRWGCELACCGTDGCNIAVFQETDDRDCYLFDCGTIADFRCVFSVHENYVAMGMMIDRADLEKTRLHDSAKHEVALNVMHEKHKTQPNYDSPPQQSLSLQQPLQQPRPQSRPIAASRIDPSSTNQPAHREQLADMTADRRLINQQVAREHLPRTRPPPQQHPHLQPQQRSPQHASGDTSVGKARSPFREQTLPRVAPPQQSRAACHGQYEWRCGSGECIPVYDVCTGISQCVDGSDEGRDMCLRRKESIQRARDRAKTSASVAAAAQPKSSQSQSASLKKEGGKVAPGASMGAKSAVKGGGIGGEGGGDAEASSLGHREESMSLAGVVLGLGVVVLAVFLLFLCCRFRAAKGVATAAPRRRRQGKMKDSAEADLLINGLHL